MRLESGVQEEGNIVNKQVYGPRGPESGDLQSGPCRPFASFWASSKFAIGNFLGEHPNPFSTLLIELPSPNVYAPSYFNPKTKVSRT